MDRKSLSSVPLPSNIAILSGSTVPGHFSSTSSSTATTTTLPSNRNIVVIFDASREMSSIAVEWTLERILQHGDVLTHLGILPQTVTGIAKLMRYKPQKGTEQSIVGNQDEEICKKLKLYSLILSDIQKACEDLNASLDIRIVTGYPLNLVAVTEIRKLQPTWVILDRNMKRHRKHINDQLSCNMILMDRNNEGKILKLCAPVVLGPSLQFQDISSDSQILDTVGKYRHFSSSGGDSDSDTILTHSKHALRGGTSNNSVTVDPGPSENAAVELDAVLPRELDETNTAIKLDKEKLTTDEAITEDTILFPKPGSSALPLCSICKHKPRDFKRQTREFTYSELQEATDNFSHANFLAEGGFGFVYKGVLKGGQHIAVKQHKLASTQGGREFCAEVKVLSGAQHRNLVTLLGFCVEDGKRMLVYEFVCNKSLDYHLFDKNTVLPWCARQGIALGAARAMRYLHEECRVGTIIHRDLRPHNILLTHDYAPMVGDFGLARWHTSSQPTVETKVIGTLGYLAPEYASSGQVTEKADVYSFGVILLEMVTGRRSLDISLPHAEQCLTEWARPKLDVRDADSLLDPRLVKDLLQESQLYEIQAMVHAAAFCLRREPSQRPRMSQVLRILEGERGEAPTIALTISTTWDPTTKSRIPRVPSNTTLKSPSKQSFLSYNEMITS